MYRKDFIEAEIQELNQVLARILALKHDGKIEEAHKTIAITLSESFQLDEGFLNTASPEEIGTILSENNFNEEKLNILSELLFESAHPFEDIPEISNRLHLVLVVFNWLEKEYHVQSLDNIAKRQMIDKFLNTSQYE